MHYTEIFFSEEKKWKFHWNFFDIWNIFALNIDCGYTLEPPVLKRTYNLCFGAKIRKIGIPLHTPVLQYKSGVQGGILYTNMFSWWNMFINGKSCLIPLVKSKICSLYVFQILVWCCMYYAYHLIPYVQFLLHISHVTSKTVFGVFSESACSVTENWKKLEILEIRKGGIVPSMQRKQWHWSALQLLHSWSVSLFFALAKVWFTHDMADTVCDNALILLHMVCGLSCKIHRTVLFRTIEPKHKKTGLWGCWLHLTQTDLYSCTKRLEAWILDLERSVIILSMEQKQRCWTAVKLLICVFIFSYAKSRSFHDTAYYLIKETCGKTYTG